MKAVVTILILVMCVLCMAAQTEVPDTLKSQELNEIVVQAPKVIHKADMDLYYPSKGAVENSKNGVQLLRNLMIPALTVNDVMQTITASGQDVQLRINGRVASITDVKALLPESIKRVEWLENPGLRYGGANYVLNIIVRNPELGGSLMADATQGLTEAWGHYFADAKVNIERSQLELGGNFKLTNHLSTNREYTERFVFPDGSSLTRNESSLGGSVNNSFGSAWLSYSYIKPDTTVFYASVSAESRLDDRMSYDGLLSLSDGSDNILLRDVHGDKGTTPTLSLYLEQHFAGKQMLVVDFNASLYSGHTFSDYVESMPDGQNKLNDIHTYINDRNQAYAIEADYIKNWENSRLDVGASYAANRNRSEYENLGGRIFHQRQDKVYFFAEYFQKINKVTLTAGLGAQYTDILFRETGQGNHSWNLRPQFTATYSPNRKSQFRLNFTSWQSAPTLAETNIAPQQLDGFQWRIGNPYLKTSTSYMLTLRYNFTLPRVNGMFGVRAFTSPDAITPYLYWDEGRLVTSYENSRGLQNLSFWLSPQIEVVPDWLTLAGTVQYRAERMRGTGYKLYSRKWSGDVTAQLSHWGFTLTAQYRRAQRDLWGEKISWGEDMSLVNVQYNWKDWEFGAGMLMPFGKYDQGSISLSRYNTNEMHMRPKLRIPFVSVGWNLQWGRQKNGAQKRINADANVERSSAGGR